MAPRIMKRPAVARVAVAEMKRPAAAPAPVRAKKARKLSPLEAKCEIISTALMGKDDLPENTRQMLCESLATCLGVYKADRHDYQNLMVEMVSEVVAQMAATSKEAVNTAKAQVDGAQVDKKERIAKSEDIARRAQTATATVEQATKKHEDDTAAWKKTDAELTSKTAELSQYMAELDVKAAEKQKFVDTLNNKYLPVKAEDRPEGFEATVKDLIQTLKDLKFDLSMVSSFELIVDKKPSAWSSFDLMVAKQIEGEFDKIINKLDGELQEGTPEREQKEQAIKYLEASVETLKGQSEASAAALTEASQAAADLKKDLEGAQKSVRDFQSDLKTICDKLDEAVATEAAFQKGPVATLEELIELAPPPEPVEEEPVEEEPAEAKPDEAAVETAAPEADAEMVADAAAPTEATDAPMEAAEAQKPVETAAE